jgi:hypothetical protein
MGVGRTAAVAAGGSRWDGGLMRAARRLDSASRAAPRTLGRRTRRCLARPAAWASDASRISGGGGGGGGDSDDSLALLLHSRLPRWQ